MKVFLKFEGVNPEKFAAFCSYVDNADDEVREIIAKQISPSNVHREPSDTTIVRLLKTASYTDDGKTLMVVELVVICFFIVKAEKDGSYSSIAFRVPMSILSRIFDMLGKFAPGEDFVQIADYKSRSDLV